MTPSLTPERLYRLLPAIYRLRDAAAREPLRALVAAFAGEIAALEEDVAQLYDDQFIETCAPWVAPYIGDLVGYRPLHGVVPRVASPRAEVANTIAYRRRKGTALMLEQLAADVTGWPAHAVEFFERLATTQYMKHIRLHALATAELRDLTAAFAEGGAFGRYAHTAEMRRPETGAGRYNIPNVGIFLWRLRPFRLAGLPLVPDPGDASGRRFRLNPLGADLRLFRSPRPEVDIAHLAEPINVPEPLSVRTMALSVRAAQATSAPDAIDTDDYGPGESLLLERPGTAPPALPVTQIRICDLRDVFDSVGGFVGWNHEAAVPPGTIGLDPERGRILLGAPADGPLRATFHYAQASAIGGGDYDRTPEGDDLPVQRNASSGAGLQPDLDAIAGGGRLLIDGSLTYAGTPDFKVSAVTAPGAAGHTVVVAARDGMRPLVAAATDVPLSIGARGRLVIDGLVIAGGALRLAAAADDEPREIVLRDCTLIPGLTLAPDGSAATPGAPSLVIAHPFARVSLERCITGPILAPADAEVSLIDCILDAGAPEAVAYAAAPAGGPGATLTLERSTVIGKLHAGRIALVSNAILFALLAAAGETWPAPVIADRRQDGCIRFSFVPPGAVTPSRHRCLPDAGRRTPDAGRRTPDAGRRTPAGPAALHLAALRRSGLRPASPRYRRGDPHRRRRWQRDGGDARSLPAAARDQPCGPAGRISALRPAGRCVLRHLTPPEETMGADLSRVRLNPLLDYAGVELKQGAVLLDADANELVGIVDRRLRALASDVLGRATVSATTPDAFRITLAGGGLAIGPGRLYVDGLLAENHGAALPAGRRFDPLLAEPAFTDPIGYAAQPWLPNPAALPAAGRHLVYLDVWTRELTHLERPDLAEPAVNVETSSRLQTVWQVRVAPEDVGAAATCATPDADLPGWDEIIAPAAGRLTADTFDIAPADDPCELPPTGGYRGLENQLYRVEIHDPGLPGAGATFKWSRENASVGSRVASMISAGELELVTLGRDDVLGLRTGNWIEITSEAHSLAGLPGEIRKATVFEATRRVQFAPGLPADLLPASFPDTAFPAANGMIVRRWDQERKVFRTGSGGVAVQDLDAPGSKGVIGVPAATVTLLVENGVTVRFGTSGAGSFRSGDYWVFAARTADASVELLDRAPPRGIHHHFARLAIWDVAAGSLTDCRTPWPPATGEGHDCSCTACVTPESHASGTLTIQAAVDAVAQTGGTVCLLPGQYPLREPVRLAGTRLVRIRGHGPATLLAAAGTAFALSDCQGVAITDLAVLSLATRPAITVTTALGLALERLVLATVGDSDRRAAALSLGGVVAGARFADSAIFGDTGIVALDGTMDDDEGRPDFLLTAALVIEDNAFWCPRRAMALEGTVLHLLETRVAGNSVTACRETAVSAIGLGLAGASLSVSRNSLAVSGDGLRLSGDGLLVEGNSIGGGSEEGTGIVLANGLARAGPACCRLLDSRITGFQTAAIAVTAPVRDVIAKLNVIESCGAGILVSDAADDAAVSIENNHLRDIGRGREDDDGIVLGIAVLRGAGATIRGNTLRSIGTEAIRPAARVGIFALGSGRARICGNEIVGLAPRGDFVGQALGILVVLPLTTFEVRDNRVERDAVPTDDPSNGAWTALSSGGLGDGAAVGHLGPFSTVVTGRAPSLFLGAFRPALLAATDAPALVLGNLVVARGDTPAVRLSAADCQFSDNRVEARLNRRIAVSIRAPIVVMHGNRVIGGERSVELPAATSGTAALVGNITSADIGLPGGLGPWAPLNLIV